MSYTSKPSPTMLIHILTMHLFSRLIKRQVKSSEVAKLIILFGYKAKHIYDILLLINSMMVQSVHKNMIRWNRVSIFSLHYNLSCFSFMQ